MGFGPGLFEKDGKDRYELANRRPAPLADLPRFNGDQLVPAHIGDDLCVQSCAGDPQTAFHAVRVLAALAYKIATPRWTQTIGRQKASGTPLGGHREFDPLTLKQTDTSGNPVTPESAHARLAAPEENGGAQIFRRAYSYDNGLSYVAERWPPWRQGNEFDAGLMFLAYQQDPRTGFTKIFERMSKFDMMNQFVTHVGGGLFACPGRAMGAYIGQTLLET